jgi:hypothetical protein
MSQPERDGEREQREHVHVHVRSLGRALSLFPTWKVPARVDPRDAKAHEKFLSASQIAPPRTWMKFPAPSSALLTALAFCSPAKT